MKVLLVFLLGILWTTTADSQCLYPPCHGDDQVRVPPAEALHQDDCCSETKQELAEMKRNVSNLWFTVSEFREVVARHLHHLHQHQTHMFNTRMRGETAHAHTLDSSATGGHGSDHFYGLNHESAPRAFSRPPKVRNPEDFDFAVCHMRPNSALPTSDVRGIIYLSQKKNSDTMFIHMMLSGFNTSITQHVQQQQQNEEAVHFHGIHVHEKADLSNGCDSTGPHYNPLKLRHGGPDSAIRHQGDFGNVVSDTEGAINELITDEVASLRGRHSVVGRSLVIHAMEDDLGSNLDDPGSTSTGNSGARLACCIIEKLNVPIPSYRKQKSHDHELENLDQQVVQKVQSINL